MLFTYKYDRNNNEGQCDIHIRRHAEFTVVLCTQREDNPDSDPSASAEYIATQVCREHNIDPKTLLWIVHYPAGLMYWGEPGREVWELVTFEFNRASVASDIPAYPQFAELKPYEAQTIINTWRPPPTYFARRIRTEPSDRADYGEV